MIIKCSRCHLRYDASGKPAMSRVKCRCGSTMTVPAAKPEAVALHCPNCGSPASPHATRCDFCESQLAVLHCPKCFSLQFSGSRYCSHCGDRLEKAIRAETDKGMNCPRCAETLQGHDVEGGRIERCPGCGGVWLDHDLLDIIIARAREVPDVSTLLGKLPGAVKEVDTRAVKYLPCPECNTLMHRRNFGMRSGVIVDVCTAHGIWFDEDELAAAISFVKSGGDQGSFRRGVVLPERTASSSVDYSMGSGYEQRRRGVVTDWTDLISVFGDLISWLR
ncbi:MAG: zf-TFIIB domain-containing protein [bacterium]